LLLQTQVPFQVYNASAGSGKTFTLVKEYLKILLKANDIFYFQKILAITFTNKAAAEMKTRIIESLREFSNESILESDNQLFKIIKDELGLAPKIIQEKSEQILHRILNNYAAFNITTIDSFTYKLIKSFAFDLGLSLNFEVEMDAISLINEAVDVLISKIGENKELTKTLIDFSIQKANEDKSWDIALDLKEIAKLLLNENDLAQIEKIQRRPIQDFIDLKNSISKQQKNIEKQFEIIGKNTLKLINGLELDFKDFYRSQIPTYFNNLAHHLDKIKFAKDSSLAKNIENNVFYAKSKPQHVKEAIDSIIPELIRHYKSSELLFQSYLRHKLISKSLVPLAILQSINGTLTSLKEDKNVRLNAEFNQLISKQIKAQPAAFIYEKIGEKYRHYFIDEMQDTSILQWQNLIPLIENALTSENLKGEKGSLLLVGDAKQAIYRWRGGKAEQFIDLSNQGNPFHVDKQLNQLDTNYRSYSEIIDFNNSLFQHFSKYLKNQDYQQLYLEGNQQKTTDKKGGFVQLSFVESGLNALEKNQVFPEKILDILNQLDSEFNLSDVCILTRTRKQGVAVAEYLTRHDIDIISSETLLIKNATKVNFVINFLKSINQTDDKNAKFEILHFLHQHLNIKEDLHAFIHPIIDLENNLFFEALNALNTHFNVSVFKSLAFYESIEYIIRSFHLTETSDAHLQFFLDVILDYSQKKQDSLAYFLEFWEDKKDKLSIVVPEGKNAVRIMTIHKAKGLEFPVVIYPFDLDIYKQINPKVWYEPLDKKTYNDFNAVLVNYNTTLKNCGETGEFIYESQKAQLELDNFNLLYVALTRAKEQLFIISEHKKMSGQPRYYSQFFIDYLLHIGKWQSDESVYNFGDKKRLSQKVTSSLNNFEQDDFISSPWQDHNISIVANSVLDTENNARTFGNLIHEILAKIKTTYDLEPTLLSFKNSGLISEENYTDISGLLKKIISHPQLKQYYLEDVNVLNEREIVTEDQQIIIPDRLVFEDKNVTIIDYKTGKEEKTHVHQINNYAQVLERMHFTITKKLLIYIDTEIIVKMVD
jgi:ATP-dependent exoDNAse (exonuclease V) beta subunit